MKSSENPTIFHVTHWKAGSQWIHKILRACVPKMIVTPQINELQFLEQPIQQGKVYPTLYITKQQFDSVFLPPFWKRFVIIRDLRDTLISGYFSLKISHPIIDPLTEKWHQQLNLLNKEEGLLYFMDEWLPYCIRIQKSWLDHKEPFIRYEDLLSNDLNILEKVLLVDCQLPVSREKFAEVLLANRFDAVTKGRQRGQEDISAHERKGIAGDWKNHFSAQHRDKFKNLAGDILVRAGYEENFNW